MTSDRQTEDVMNKRISKLTDIEKLNPGQSIAISQNQDGSMWTTCERSGDGKVVRFVRHTANSFRVFRTRQF